uniref:Galectin n=1 Tax=Meloidogyne floridensis TaxID=298350 RepID=A0A915NIX8_9BILA
MQINYKFSLIKIILCFEFYKITKSNLYIKIEWRKYEKNLPPELYNKLDQTDKNRFELKLYVKKLPDSDNYGYTVHSKMTEKYDYCKFNKYELSTNDKTPIAFQKNNYSLEVLFNKQILLGPVQIDGGTGKAIIIPLISSEKILYNSNDKREFLDFERPTRVLKFVVNKFQKNLKMSLTCLMGRSLVFNLVEDSNYYSTLYYYRRVCTADKYLLIIEDNEYNIPAIPIECDEAIYENQIENLYYITIQNLEENNPMISSLCKLNRNNPQTKNLNEINYELEKYKKLNNKRKHASTYSQSFINETKNKDATDKSTGIENTRKNQQMKEIQKQIEREHFDGTNYTENINEKLLNELFNDAQKHVETCSKAIDTSQDFLKFIYKNENLIKDGVVDNEGIKQIDKYLEDIKVDNEYLEKMEAKSISLINELTKNK